MEMHSKKIYIDKIFNGIKKRQEIGFFYRDTPEDGLVLTKHTINAPLKRKNDLDYLVKVNGKELPLDYICFLKLSDGISLFIDEDEQRPQFYLYSLDYALKNHEDFLNGDLFAIGEYLDNGELFIDLSTSKDELYCLELSDGERFEYSFQEWLNKLIICQGYEFWNFNLKFQMYESIFEDD